MLDPRYSYPQTLSQIMNQNEMINMPSTTVSRQKREKKPALIFDEEGNQVDLIKLAHAVDVKVCYIFNLHLKLNKFTLIVLCVCVCSSM